MGRFLLGAILGAFVGALGGVVYAGPVDLPIVGLVLAAAIVASGAWFLLDWKDRVAWGGYAIAVTAMTFYLLMRGQGVDALVVPDMWPAETWLVVAPIAAVVPAFIVRRRRVRRV
ncbi:MAG: hypothetical protein LKJ57_07515 [Ancrocorticia sp.]|jgi:hypothetical protein|nr:hypothetical protein [Ancrocorticia sp.]MCI1896679.1 hypothetical protein [Ancrocorticia sp.]MCI1933238.1 hypothetical protein [Ancrocorticia sp.]MCI1963890.1 hypothetical protein [Ancrocorticia sp.]MCI2001573.1 hypothetical protein [Ancrocorticia sp.]